MEDIMKETNRLRRSFLKGIGVLGGIFAIRQVHATHTDTHFEEETEHNIVYQCNKIDPDYLEHIMFSVGEMVRKYGDDIQVIVTAFGPGLHLLLKHPIRPVPPLIQQRVTSLQQYGVKFHACGNTMESLNVTEKDLIDGVKVVPIGIDDLMQLQEQGYAYVSW
jgi:intracellular sulfur oxidation DsrE/DsrF family protein